MAAAVQRKQHLSDDEDGADGVTQQAAQQQQETPSHKGVAAAAAAVRRLYRQTLWQRFQQRLAKLRYWLWCWIEELFEVRDQQCRGSFTWLGAQPHCLLLFLPPCLCLQLQEFQPWLKWIIFDAALTLLVGQLVKHVEFVRPAFEAVGWA